jgi:hypothetical protein
MQEALRFLLPDAEPVERTDFLEQARLARRGPEVWRGLPLTIRGLRKSFGENEVLRGIDLHIPAGQFVAIVGRSGGCCPGRGFCRTSRSGLAATAHRRTRKSALKRRSPRSVLTTSAVSGRPSSPADKSNASRSRVRWSAIPAFWRLTNRSARSMP